MVFLSIWMGSQVAFALASGSILVYDVTIGRKKRNIVKTVKKVPFSSKNQEK